MKKILFCILCILITNIGFSQTGQYLPAGIDLLNPGAHGIYSRPWKLVFQDEFQYYGTPNTNKWITSEGGKDYVGDGSASTYKAHNVWVDGEYCRLTVQKESADWNGEHFDYTSAEIKSNDTYSDPRDRHQWGSGMFQARITMAGGEWTHNNFWIIGGNEGKNGEIDICEVRGRIGHKTVPHNVHRYFPCYNGDPSGKITDEYFTTNTYNFKTHLDFHIYTCIWDKYFIYFFVDDQYTGKVPKLFYQKNNIKTNALPFENTTTLDGYYWPYDPNTSSNNPNQSYRDYFYPINSKGHINLHVFLDKRVPENIKDKVVMPKQDKGLPSAMLVDWVRVYERPYCDIELTEVTNSTLLPFEDISAKHIELGTKAIQYQWDNIAKPWGHDPRITNIYKGKTITLLHNFIVEPILVDPTICTTTDPNNTQYGSTIFEACNCCSSPPTSELIWYNLPEESPEMVPDSFDCTGIDTVGIDSMIAALLLEGDTLSVDTIISYIEDTLGCTYWGYGGENKAGRNYSLISNVYNIKSPSIYPNPTTGSFTVQMPQSGNYTIRVMNLVGSTVYEGEMDGEQKKAIQLDQNLPPGNYTIHINGDGLRHIEKLVITK